MYDILELIDICKKETGKNIYIQTHNFPDADAIATAFALHELFNVYGVENTLCFDGSIDRMNTESLLKYTGIKFLTEDELQGIMKPEDCIICVDSQKSGGNITDFIGDEIACIDHHPTYKEVEYKWKQVEQVGACSTLMAEHFKRLDITPSIQCATALLYGLKIDTMHFTRGVTDRDIDAFKYLFNLVDKEILHMLETNSLEINDLKAYGSAIRNIRLYGKVGISKIPFACPDALIADLSDFILSLEEVDVAVIYSARKDGYKFSFRSMVKEVDAGVLAHSSLKGIGNGGGHSSMAGGFVPMDKYNSLGDYPDENLTDRFVSLVNSMI